MKTGLLWFDNDPALSLSDKLPKAVRRYARKFGQEPNVCYVHPSALADGNQVTVGGVRVLPLPTVLRNHFWLGVEQ